MINEKGGYLLFDPVVDQRSIDKTIFNLRSPNAIIHCVHYVYACDVFFLVKKLFLVVFIVLQLSAVSRPVLDIHK